MPPRRPSPKPARYALRRVVAFWAASLPFGVLLGCSSGEARPAPHLVDAAPPAQTVVEGVHTGDGAILLAGGGRLGPEIFQAFVDRAGGADARIVVIPTAGADEEYPQDLSGLDGLREAGARDIVVLHTRDRQEAETADFVAPLLMADGVWIPGGRQWRLVDAYLHTRTHEEIRQVLRRGGVVGGTSAGASILASYLVRGDPATNEVVMAPGYEEGFGILAGTAVDQHLLRRGREQDLLEVVGAHPHLLGIGLDEGTAMMIEGTAAIVLGVSRVAIYNSGGGEGEASPGVLPYFFLSPGDTFHLDTHRVVRSGRADQ